MSGVVSYELLNSKLPTGNGWTADGGFYATFVNNTGAASVKGTIVVASSVIDNAVSIAPAGSTMPLGIIAESGIANGQNVKVVIYGKAYVLLRDAEPATRGYWCGVSAVAGRMYQHDPLLPIVDPTNKIGYSLQTTTAGTNKLSLIQVNFN